VTAPLAERTGDPELDALIEEFRQGQIPAPLCLPPTQREAWDLPVNAFREPEHACWRCDAVSGAFVRFLERHGVEAIQEWIYPTATYQGRQYDLPQCIVYVRRDGRVFGVDWTAIQFGRPEFPVVVEISSPIPDRDLFSYMDLTA